MDNTQKVLVFNAVILLGCLLPLPYGCYTLARIVTTFISIYLAFNYFSRNKSFLAIIFGIIAVIFQPFIKFPIGREVWVCFDIFIALLMFILAMNNNEENI